FQALLSPDLEGVSDVFQPFLARKPGLGARGNDPFEQSAVDQNSHCAAQLSGQALGLVEFPLAFLGCMERNRDDEVPFGLCELELGPLNEEVRQERLKPKRAVVLVFEQDVSGGAPRQHGGTREKEMPFLLQTGGAFEFVGDVAFEGASASFAERPLDELDAFA